MGKKTGKGSRKAARKKYQRKIDVSDIIAGNEAAKKEERMATVPNDSLFVVDRKSDNIIIPKAKRRKLAQSKVTSLEKAAYYQSDPAPSPFTPTIKPKTSINEWKMNEEVQKRKRKRADSSPLMTTTTTTTTITTTTKRNTNAQRRQIAKQKASEGRARKAPQEDLWDTPAPFYPISQKKVGKGQEKLKEDKSNFASGFSYNPDKEKHQDVLAIAVADELQKVRDIDEVEDFFKVSKSVKRLSKGMDSTIPFFGPRDDDDEEEEETDDEDEDFPAYRPTSADPRRKTQTERNKEMKKRVAKRQMEGERRAKKKKRDPRVSVMVVREAVEQADQVEKKRDAQRQYLAEKKEEVTTASYNKNKIPARPMPVLLTDQLPSTLRQMPEVEYFNPISEQFEKFQKKGVIEAREKKGKPRKHTPKRYRKHEYKDFMDQMDENDKTSEKPQQQQQQKGKKGK